LDDVLAPFGLISDMWAPARSSEIVRWLVFPFNESSPATWYCFLRDRTDCTKRICRRL